MGILSGLALIFIIVGLVSLTYIMTRRRYSINNNNNNKTEDSSMEKEKMYKDRPSKVFNNMFTQPDIWMGYADLDTKAVFKGKLI